MFFEERMSSYVKRGKSLIDEGKTQQAMQIVERGLQHYSDKIIKSLYPYEKTDAGLLVYVLRHLANEIEKNNVGAKELYEGMKKCVKAPSLKEVQKTRKVNRY